MITKGSASSGGSYSSISGVAFGVGWVKQDHIVRTMTWNRVQNVISQIAVRIDHRDSQAGTRSL